MSSRNPPTPAIPAFSASPLPPTVRFDGDGVSAWNLLLRAEKAARKEPTTTNHLVAVRVLGFFVKDFWEHQGSHDFGLRPYKHLLLEVKSCFHVVGGAVGSIEEIAAQHEKVFQLGLLYRSHLMCVFCSDGGPVSEPSAHSSRPSFEEARDRIIQGMSGAENSKPDVKNVALLRDGYKCMLSGCYDFGTHERHPELAEAWEGNISLTGTECAYLFSESAPDSNKSAGYVATAFTMLTMFGLDQCVKKLLGGQVFDRFGFWLEEVHGMPNTYDVVAPRVASGLWLLSTTPARRVTFQVDPASAAACGEKGAELPELPSRNLIAIRSACARVAHMSGAAEQIDQILGDEENTLVIADDGSSADLLASLLSVGATERF